MRLLALLAVAATAAHAQSDDWTAPAKDFAATRYSGLAQITPANVKNLHAIWTFSTGVLGGHEGQPLVVKNTMYVVTPYPNVLYAFDLTQEGYPLKWKYRPAVDQNAVGLTCCDVVNRGAAYADGKIVYNLLDGHTVAVDAATGRELWKTPIADLQRGETVTMAPLVVKNRVIVGASGGEFGILGSIKGLDLATGHLVWTATNLGPDSSMHVSPSFKTPYDTGAQLGLRTWPPDAWRHGGGPVWGWLSYDSTLDLV
ncbi:MAG TPA: PQQ-binding-like beta-propeller repeat protein, partial [Gemmatimonadaceae bacterium]|nr:PQQ-binding-like beta-propeller repeat protein [Gemmatimonadaceae bacterium]